MTLRPIWRMPIDEGAPVALTFDDGPNPPHTLELIELLAGRRLPATFFFIGENAAEHPDVVHRALEAGMSIGVHSWDHQDLCDRSRAFVDEQIERTLGLLRELGADPHLFRAPYNTWDENVLDAAFAAGLVTVAGSVDPRDWAYPGTDVIASRVREAMHPGAIVMLHDGGGDRSQTVAAVRSIVDDIAGAGQRVVDLVEQLTI